MNAYDKEQLAQIPAKYRPLTAWQIFGWSIVFALPFVGWVLLIVFCFLSDSIPRRSFARSYFCGAILVFVLVLILLATGVLTQLLAQNT